MCSEARIRKKMKVIQKTKRNVAKVVKWGEDFLLLHQLGLTVTCLRLVNFCSCRFVRKTVHLLVHDSVSEPLRCLIYGTLSRSLPVQYYLGLSECTIMLARCCTVVLARRPVFMCVLCFESCIFCLVVRNGPVNRTKFQRTEVTSARSRSGCPERHA